MRRLLERLDTPDKAWKAPRADAMEREYWKDDVKAYERALTQTDVASAPWWVVPANDKRNARLIVSQIVIDTLESLGLTPPPIDPDRKRELKRDPQDVGDMERAGLWPFSRVREKGNILTIPSARRARC